jgi:hypothetical protein
MKYFRYISRIIVGLVFIFSGIVKAIDPLGTVYKFQDYFQAFDLAFLKQLALPAAIALCSLELISGISVLFNIRYKAGIRVVLILMIIFTPLTFILALTNPVTDCGCFGDAIHLTNWQTFFKNIILLIPVIYLLITEKQVSDNNNHTRQWVILSLSELFFLIFISYNLRYLPVIDFLPYKKGTYIPDKMVIPEGVPSDKYATTFIYEKDGQKKEFTLNNYPSDDTTWKFVEQKSVLVSRGYQAPIHDFVITTISGTDITKQVLESKGYTILMISKKLEESDPELLQRGYDLGIYCIGNMIDFHVLTSSESTGVKRIDNGLSFCLADETTLKTMIRSNPGYILLKKGTVLNKWSWANIPENETISELINKK